MHPRSVVEMLSVFSISYKLVVNLEALLDSDFLYNIVRICSGAGLLCFSATSDQQAKSSMVTRFRFCQLRLFFMKFPIKIVAAVGDLCLDSGFR